MVKNMKRMLFLILFVCSFVCAQRQGLPSLFSVGGFAVQKYEANWANEFPGGEDGLNVLVSSMERHIKDKYPSVDLSSTKYFNSAATRKNFLDAKTNNLNFLYYHGHGNANFITMWDKYQYVYNTQKKFKNYWVMLVACNVFRNGLRPDGKTPYSNQDPWFDGVHSILGFASIVWGGTLSRSCGFLNLSTCRQHSWDMEEEFAERWIKNKETIWSAFKYAVYNQLYDFGDKYERNKPYLKGIIPKIVYRYGKINGVSFEPYEEKFENAYQGPIFQNNYDGIASRWVTYGTPAYED
jgi:hypothetical protein